MPGGPPTREPGLMMGVRRDLFALGGERNIRSDRNLRGKDHTRQDLWITHISLSLHDVAELQNSPTMIKIYVPFSGGYVARECGTWVVSAYALLVRAQSLMCLLSTCGRAGSEYLTIFCNRLSWCDMIETVE